MILTDLDYATISETKAGLSGLMKRILETKRALVVTNHGKPAVIVLGFEEYRQMARRLEEMEAALKSLKDSVADPIEAIRGSGKGEGLLKALLVERRKDRRRADRPRRG